MSIYRELYFYLFAALADRRGTGPGRGAGAWGISVFRTRNRVRKIFFKTY